MGTDTPTYTVIQLPGAACWAVMSADGRRRAVCDREADAQRIAYSLRITDESEQTARRDEAAA
jgi:hypothetical protein